MILYLTYDISKQMAEIMHVNRALNTFFDIKIDAPQSKNSLNNGLDEILKTTENVLRSGFRNMNCMKFHIICNAKFQASQI